jgi:hypothetical protein
MEKPCHMTIQKPSVDGDNDDEAIVGHPNFVLFHFCTINNANKAQGLTSDSGSSLVPYRILKFCMIIGV